LNITDRHDNDNPIKCANDETLTFNHIKCDNTSNKCSNFNQRSCM